MPVPPPVRETPTATPRVLNYAADRLTGLFDEVGYKTLSVPDIRERHLLVGAPV